MIAVIIDTETTGLRRHSSTPLSEQPRVIELAVLRIERGRIAHTDSWVCNPGQQITAEITRITGITNDHLSTCYPFKDYLSEIKAAFRGADMLIAHNAPFDVGMIRDELEREACSDFPWPANTVCTVQNYQHLFGHYPNLKKLYLKIVGHELTQKHRAIEDCVALYAILDADGFFSATKKGEDNASHI